MSVVIIINDCITLKNLTKSSNVKLKKKIKEIQCKFIISRFKLKYRKTH